MLATALAMGSFVGLSATVASAATTPACSATPTPTSTCQVNTHLATGTWNVHGNAPTTFPATNNAGFTGTENPATGAITGGTFTVPAQHESNKGSVETIIWSQITPQTAHGSITSKGVVSLTSQFQVLIHITAPITATCLSTPVTFNFNSSTNYASTSVTVADSSFSVPDFVDTPEYTCGLALATLNKTFPGSTGNQMTLSLNGKFVVPAVPTTSSATTLSVSPVAPAATGGSIAGQPTKLIASVGPGGQHGVTGAVQFLDTTANFGSPVTLVPGAGSSPATATLTTKTLPVGTNQLKAVYGGSGTYLGSTSPVASYLVKAPPVVNLAYPTTVVTAGATTPTVFSGVISDPANGASLSNVRLTFTFSGVSSLTAASTHFRVCTTAALTTCTTIPLASSANELVGSYGGHGSATFSLNPGTQIRKYFSLAFTTSAFYGNLVITTALSSLTASGTTVRIANLATQSAIVKTLRSTSPTALHSFTISEGVAGTTKVTIGGILSTTPTSRQGYNVVLRISLGATSAGPSPSGIISFFRAPISSPATKTPLGSINLPTAKTVAVYLTSTKWAVGSTYQITATYSGDSFYQGDTATPTALHVTTAPGGTAYVCTQTRPITREVVPNVRVYVTSVQGGTLPTSAPVGSAVSLDNVTANVAVDYGQFGTTLGPRGAALNAAGAGLSPVGSAVGVLPTGGTPPARPSAYGVAVDAAKHLGYVTDNGANQVVTFTENTQEQIGSVTVGADPQGLVFDPTAGTTGLIYAANNGAGSVSVISAKTDAVIATIPVGTEPTGVTVNPRSHKVYVTNTGSNSVSVIDTSTNTVVGTITTTIDTSPTGIAVDPTLGATGTVYVAYNTTGPNTVTTISGSTDAVTHQLTLTTTRTHRQSVAVDPVTHKVYVPSTTKVTILSGTAANGPSVTQSVSLGASVGYGVTVDPLAGPTVGGVRQGTVWLTGTSFFTSKVVALNGTGSTLFTTKGNGVVRGVAIDPGLGPTGTAEVAGSGTYGGTVTLLSGTTGVSVGAFRLSAGWITVPWARTGGTTVRRTLTTTGVVHLSGTAGLGTNPGPVAVGLSSLTWTVGPVGSSSWSYSCKPVTAPATLGTVNVVGLSKPSVTAQPASTTVATGSAATFSAGASGVAAPTVQWQSSTDGGSTWTNIAGATSTTYTTGPTSGTQDGTLYRAVFTNASGSTTTASAVLTVNVPPTVTASPASQVVTAGTPATFSASATARPAPSVQWQVSTNGGNGWGNIAAATSNTLTVSSTKQANGNQYRAVFTNALGQATSAAATLAVTTGGYRLVGADGAIYAYGSAPFYGSMGGQPLNKPIVGSASTPTGGGYWEVASDGGIFAFGNAKFYGSMGGQPLNKPIVGMAATPTGKGYWEVASDGGIFAFGNAQFYGSTGSMTLNQPIVGMAATPTGGGYWLVASDGGIFAFGNAKFAGSTGSIKLAKPIVGMTPTVTGGGYWLVASDGGIFAFGNAPFLGSGAGGTGSTAVVAMTTTDDGGGYWLTTAAGAVIPFGDAPLAGSAAGLPLNAPIVGITG